MKTILVPTDFSECAANAVDYAVHATESLHVNVVVLHVFNLADKVYPDTIGVDGDYIEVMLKEVRTKLNDLKLNIQRNHKITVSVLLYEGEVTSTILDVVEDLAIDLVIMGTTGASGVKEKLLGSETAEVIGKTKVPVMVIPLGYRWKKPERIVLATNHFEQDQLLLQPLFDLVSLFSAQLEVVVFTDVHDKASAIFEHKRHAIEYESLLRGWTKNDSLTVQELSSVDLEDSLETYVTEHAIDCIVMITYKRTLWQRLCHPSLTKKMSYHTKTPLLAIPG